MFCKITALIFFLLGAAGSWVWLDYQNASTKAAIIQKPVHIEIKKGESFNRITQKLIEHNVAINPYWFKFIAYQKKVTGKLKAGEYTLNPGLKIPELLELFVLGKSRQYSITFPEGWSFKEIRQEIQRNPLIAQTLNDMSNEAIMEKIDADYNYPEGLFFPDTYFFEKNMTDLSLLQRAYQKMQRVLTSEWDKKEEGLPLESPYQALILASIVEKETGTVHERPVIAGVFIQRLLKGMLLQTDPTVIYGMGESYKGNIRSKDLVTPTPYNTYVIKGLPPTPIAMPGQDSIHAVLHPEKTENLYFVARGDGSHVFSPTLKEHNRAVNIFQRKKR